MSLVAAARAAYGTTLLAVPRTVLEAFGASRDDEAAVLVARVLGARQLLQAWLQRGGAIPRLGAIVDALHAGTMASLAAGSRHYRRPAMIEGALALGLGVAGILSPR